MHKRVRGRSRYRGSGVGVVAYDWHIAKTRVRTWCRERTKLLVMRFGFGQRFRWMDELCSKVSRSPLGGKSQQQRHGLDGGGGAGINVVGGKADTNEHLFTPERWGAWTNLRKMMHWRYMFGGAGG